ncbi:Hypothetical predicted protein [Podarcis lilfordi]|uniref:Uncharacterized protein n=1 Tax=Podarcis lilfordi TaxID=74358 RepID=A0AA35KA37_9SAUR|nr:Hypothetical predicted protein [Podarcis lilfordi]
MGAALPLPQRDAVGPRKALLLLLPPPPPPLLERGKQLTSRRGEESKSAPPRLTQGWDRRRERGCAQQKPEPARSGGSARWAFGRKRCFSFRSLLGCCVCVRFSPSPRHPALLPQLRGERKAWAHEQGAMATGRSNPP